MLVPKSALYRAIESIQNTQERVTKIQPTERHRIASTTLLCDQCGQRVANWIFRKNGTAPYITSCSNPTCLQKADKVLQQP